MDGQTPEGNVPPGFRTPCPSSSSHSNNKQMCHRMHRDLRARPNLDASGNKETCNVRIRTSMVWCAMFWSAMDSQQPNVYAADSASACTEFWLCECAWWTKVWWFSKLRSEPKELPRKHAEWPGWSDFGRFDASSSARSKRSWPC